MAANNGFQAWVGGFVLLSALMVVIGIAGNAVDARFFPEHHARVAAAQLAEEARDEVAAALRTQQERAVRTGYLKAHPEEANFSEGANLREWGHYWDPTEEEKTERDRLGAIAEMAEQDLHSATNAFPPEGGDFRPYNARVTAAYRRWTGAARAAWGENWQEKWEAAHTVSAENCPAYSKVGIPREACEIMAANPRGVPSLDSLLMTRRSGPAVADVHSEPSPGEVQGELPEAPAPS